MRYSTDLQIGSLAMVNRLRRNEVANRVSRLEKRPAINKSEGRGYEDAAGKSKREIKLPSRPVSEAAPLSVFGPVLLHT